MGFSVNAVPLIGRRGHDPDLRDPPEGIAVTRFTLTTGGPARAGSESETDRHQLVCWRQLGEFAGKYLAKGRRVFVAGRLTSRTWAGRHNQQRRAVEIVATEIGAHDRRPEAERPDVGGDDEVPVAAEGDDVAL